LSAREQEVGGERHVLDTGLLVLLDRSEQRFLLIHRHFERMHRIIRGTSDHDAVCLAHRARNVPFRAFQRSAQIGATDRIDLFVRKLRLYVTPCQQIAHLLARLGEARAIRHSHNDGILCLARAVRASLFFTNSGG
jgi:hypothetical protein